MSGDYRPDDPHDINLLRFDVYVKADADTNAETVDGWAEVEDASYCTNMPATASEDVLEKALRCIFKRYRDVITGPDYPSVKKLGEELSHISENDFSSENSSNADLADASAEPAEDAIPAILVERDYKGEYERFALTETEFQREFPETYARFGPIEKSDADTLRPLVHIWFCPCFVGDEVWKRFFTDMADGLPDSDIESGNLATVNKDLFGELLCYLPDDDATVDNQLNETSSDAPSAETKRLAVTMFCDAIYYSSLDVPKEMTLDEAIAYAKAHTNDIPLGTLEYVQDTELDEANCDFV